MLLSLDSMKINYSEMNTITLVKDIILIISSATTIILAFVGLNRWKKELSGRTKHDFYRDLLSRMYQYKNGLKLLRSPLFLATEMVGVEKEMLDSEWNVLENRLKDFYPIHNKLVDLRAEFEIEFQDNDKLMMLFSGIMNTTHTYNLTINEYFQIKNRTNNGKRLLELRAILYDTSKENEFREKFNEAFNKLDEEIKKRLKKY